MPFWSRRRAASATAAKGHRIIVAPDGRDVNKDTVWKVELTGMFTNKGSAMLVGRYIASALGLQLDWRGEDGRIQDADSSGDAPDPREIPG